MLRRRSRRGQLLSSLDRLPCTMHPPVGSYPRASVTNRSAPAQSAQPPPPILPPRGTGRPRSTSSTRSCSGACRACPSLLGMPHSPLIPTIPLRTAQRDPPAPAQRDPRPLRDLRALQKRSTLPPPRLVEAMSLGIQTGTVEQIRTAGGLSTHVHRLAYGKRRGTSLLGTTTSFCPGRLALTHLLASPLFDLGEWHHNPLASPLADLGECF